MQALEINTIADARSLAGWGPGQVAVNMLAHRVSRRVEVAHHGTYFMNLGDAPGS